MRKTNELIAIGFIALIVGGLCGGLIGFGLTSGEGGNWEQEYNELLGEYNELLDNYNSLFNDYNVLKQAFEEPLTNPVRPTLSEFLDWLRNVDDTDTHGYTEYWMCGDFSAMLMTRAKTMNWRVRITVMIYSFDGDPNYGMPNQFGKYGHAFCMINCSDDNVYYIEPQTDAVWTVGGGIHFHIWGLYDFSGVSGTVWDGQTFWSNHYSEFA